VMLLVELLIIIKY